MSSANPYRVASLAKGLHVLHVLARARRALRLPEVAEEASIPVATTYRLLRTLQEEGYVQVTEGQRFMPGPAVLTLGFDTLGAMDIVQIARPILTELADRSGESCNLSVLVGRVVVPLFRAHSTSLVRPSVAVGAHLPTTCTSAGKALLSQLPEESLASQLEAADLTNCAGPNALRDPGRIRADLELTRTRGWALQDEEAAHGVRSIATCVYRDSEQVAGAINLAFTASRFEVDELEREWVPVLMQGAEKISRLLGHAGSPH